MFSLTLIPDNMKWVMCKQFSDAHTSNLSQAIAAHYLKLRTDVTRAMIARADAGRRFDVIETGTQTGRNQLVTEAEKLLMSLITAGHGVAGLTMQRPGLHDAFVRIVSDAKAADAEARA